MDRPHESVEQRSVDAARRIAQRHSQRAAALARRAAAARRRLLLVATLLVLTAGAWTAVGFGALLAAVAVVPTLLLVATLGLGRAAVVSAQRNDAAWAREEAALQHAVRAAHRTARPTTTGRAVRGSDDETLVIDKVTADAPAAATRTAADGDSWQPVPVPRPTYTLKAPAPRREPAPLEIPERVAEQRVAEQPATGAGADEGQPAAPAAAAAAPPAADLDLDAILARRRAAGA